MTQLLVVIFDEVETAKQARRAVQDLQRRGLTVIRDAAVVTRDAEGKTKVHNEIDGDVKIGAGVGAVVGLLLSFSFPLLGLALGVGGGALVGKLADRGLDSSFVREVEAELQPGSSALAVVLSDVSPEGLRAALEPFKGRVYETTLAPELADQLENVLKS
jgi:uncharacterized membrane protein